MIVSHNPLAATSLVTGDRTPSNPGACIARVVVGVSERGGHLTPINHYKLPIKPYLQQRTDQPTDRRDKPAKLAQIGCCCCREEWIHTMLNGLTTTHSQSRTVLMYAGKGARRRLSIITPRPFINPIALMESWKIKFKALVRDFLFFTIPWVASMICLTRMLQETESW